MRNDYDPKNINIAYDGITTITPENKYKEKIGILKIYYGEKLLKTLPVTLNQKIYPDYKLIILASIVYMFILSSSIIIAIRIRKKKKLERI